ncbi:16S rRNA (cytosine967-C5)-methyltransferase [Haloferula luteola]|uniref:16S rRNA (Cytosine967-C5)-methyltransferase n=1 Tax=Haloferula luteola TaxID=595692 RepID=A0A840V0F5_9BACT|nr:RsmB/NOP family class I SAM-dependent RNA methyltransferase [Haloferula luteola]MBB5350546.1 16S rRNA (cytosine967-C5)-methyltransferase [Haloferula luteola]
MKWHRMLAEACVHLLEQVFDEGKVLDRVMGEAFRVHPKWGKRDRHFVAESVWETVRWRRALAFVADASDSRSMLAAWWSGQGWILPDWWTWEGASVATMEGRRAELEAQPRAIRQSIPDWLDLRGFSELGEAWDAELTALNRRAPVCLRVNRQRGDREEVLAWLASEGVKAHPEVKLPDAIILEGLLPKRLASDGRMEIQDCGSQTVVPLLAVEPGDRVMDGCAGAGGKTLQLAADLAGEGELVALDVSPRKLEALARRAKIAGVRGLQTEVWNSESYRKWQGWPNRMLLDVPCSGLGTLRRQPDLKWRLSESTLEKTRRLQRRLLDEYPPLLREDGTWVYATCSILPSENQGQIQALLERDPRWECVEENRISPAGTGWDGFYAAKMVRRS